MTGPESDAEVASWVRSLGLDGLVDIHVHFLPERMLHKVWAYFDRAEEHYGMRWLVHYRLPEADRLAALRALGPIRFAPLAYPHKPGMARWLNEWVAGFAARTPEAVPTATLYPERGVSGYLEAALRAGARCVKAHVQVGDYDPRAELLAEAGVPVVVHAGHGPLRGAYTGLDVFEQVLARHPRLVTVLAHAGLRRGRGPGVQVPERVPGHHHGGRAVQRAPVAAARGLGRVTGADRGSGGAGHRFPEHSLPLRHPAAGDRGLGRRRPPRGTVPAGRPARHPRQPAHPLTPSG